MKFGPSTKVVDNSEGIVIARQQDVEPFIEAAKAARSEGAVGSGEMRHAATFPAVVVEAYLISAGITFREFLADETHVKRMLADPALKGFRIWEGRA